MNERIVLLAVLAAFVCSVIADAGQEPTSKTSQARKLAALKVTDIRGESHSPFDSRETKAVALFFVSTDCPIANTFQPTLQKFHKTYAAKGVRCFMVYTTPGLTKDLIDQHVRDFAIAAPAVHDSTQTIGKLVSARVTPEAILIDRDGSVRYRGLINNLYAGYGRKRVAASKHFLRDATDAVLAGKTVPEPKTKPIGCFIHYK